MNTRFPAHDDARYFSLTGYEAIIKRAVNLGYSVIPFREFSPPDTSPVLLLRHDLDHSLHGIDRFAEAEAACGGHAPYFIQTASEYYNILAPAGRTLLHKLVELGHEVGLHYESERYSGAHGPGNLRADIRLLEDLCGCAIESAAQHLPVDNEPLDVGHYVANEAYEPRFTETPMTYISDSLMAWRQATPHDLIDERASFQFLTHPETWLGAFDNMATALAAIRDRESALVVSRFDELTDYYAELLARRAEKDRQFRTRRRP